MPKTADPDPEPTVGQLAGRSASVPIGIGLMALGAVFFALAANDMFHGERWSKAKPIASAGLMILVIGAMTSAVSWREAKSLHRVAHVGQPVDATVSAINSSRMKLFRSSRATWVIRYEYQDPAGHSHRSTSGYLPSHEVAGWRVGDRGVIRIDPERPGHSFWTGQRAGLTRKPAAQA